MWDQQCCRPFTPSSSHLFSDCCSQAANSTHLCGQVAFVAIDVIATNQVRICPRDSINILEHSRQLLICSRRTDLVCLEVKKVEALSKRPSAYPRTAEAEGCSSYCARPWRYLVQKSGPWFRDWHKTCSEIPISEQDSSKQYTPIGLR